MGGAGRGRAATRRSRGPAVGICVPVMLPLLYGFFTPP